MLGGVLLIEHPFHFSSNIYSGYSFTGYEEDSLFSQTIYIGTFFNCFPCTAICNTYIQYSENNIELYIWYLCVANIIIFFLIFCNYQILFIVICYIPCVFNPFISLKNMIFQKWNKKKKTEEKGKLKKKRKYKRKNDKDRRRAWKGKVLETRE